MRRIEFIPGILAMRGNLSGSQELVYPSNNNKAYDAPIGQTSYARNYRPSYIGAKRAKDGLAYFSVKTKSAIGLTTKQKHNLAVQGGSFAVYAQVMQKIMLLPYLLAEFKLAKENGYTGTMRAYYSPRIREMIVEQNNNFAIFAADGSIAITVNNPWVEYTLEGIEVSDELLTKFWGELAANPIEFKVGEKKGIAHRADTFYVLTEAYYNTLNMHTGGDVSVEGVQVPGAVYIGNAATGEVQVLKDGDNFVTSSDVITAGKTYTLVWGTVSEG